MDHSTCPRSLDHITLFTLFGSHYPAHVLCIIAHVHALWTTLPLSRSLDHNTLPTFFGLTHLSTLFGSRYTLSTLFGPHYTLSALFGSRYPVDALWIIAPVHALWIITPVRTLSLTLPCPCSLDHATPSTLFGSHYFFHALWATLPGPRSLEHSTFSRSLDHSLCLAPLVTCF